MKISQRHFTKSLFLFIPYALIAFIVLHVFMLSWGFFRQGASEAFGFSNMLSCTAYRPFAYRVLMPAVVNASASLVPKGYAQAHEKWLTQDSPLLRYYKYKSALDANLALKGHIAYGYLFLSLIFLLYLMRYLTKNIYGFSEMVSASAPAAAVLLLPLTFLHGGYLYDFPELLFMGLCMICLIKKKWVLYYPLFVLTMLNKEAGALLIPCFLAFCQDKLSRKELLRHLSVQLLIAAILIIGARLLFVNNPMFYFENDLRHNIAFWLRPDSYFLFFDPYHWGVAIIPRGANIISLCALLFAIFYKWQEKPLQVRRLFMYTAICNIPLFLYAGFRDEIRTLSATFPALYLLGVHSLYRLLNSKKFTPADCKPGE